MTGKKQSKAAAITQRVAGLDDQLIDELYGLEPVYRPDDMSERAEPTRFVEVQCPYCAEVYETQVDLTAGSFTYVEDCQICCQPIEYVVEVADTGRLRSFIAQRMD